MGGVPQSLPPIVHGVVQQVAGTTHPVRNVGAVECCCHVSPRIGDHRRIPAFKAVLAELSKGEFDNFWRAKAQTTDMKKLFTTSKLADCLFAIA